MTHARLIIALAFACMMSVFEVRSTDFLLPRGLQELGGVRYFSSVPQQGPTCGYWATFNAISICRLVKKGVDVTSEAIAQESRAYARQFLPRYAGEIHSEDIEDLGKKLGTVPLILAFNNGELISLNTLFAYVADAQTLQVTSFVSKLLSWIKGDAKKNDISAHELFVKMCECIKNNMADDESALLVPIVCNTGGHWVTVVIIKEAHQSPRLIMMDSVNGYVSDGSVFSGFVHTIHKRFIK